MGFMGFMGYQYHHMTSKRCNPIEAFKGAVRNGPSPVSAISVETK